MKIDSLKYKAAKDYLEKNPLLKKLLASAVKEMISKKKNIFTEEQALNDYALLQKNKILISNNKTTYFISLESSLASAGLLDYAQYLLDESFPDTPYDAIVLIDNFFLEIRKPKINNHWYPMKFKRDFEKFILLEFEEYFLENFDELLRIYNEEHEPKSSGHKLASDLDKAIPYFDLTPAQFITLANNLHKRKKFQHKAFDIIREVSLISHEKVNGIFEIVIKEEESPFLPTIIIGLSHFNFEKSFGESLKLLDSPSTELQGISCLCRLNFNNKNELLRAFQVIRDHKSEDLDFLRESAFANKNFIVNDLATDEIKVKGIENIGKLIEHEDKEVVGQAVYWLSSIHGLEDEKMRYLTILINRGIQVDFWNYFKNFESPSYLFEFVKEVYVNLGLKASIRPFEHAFNAFYREKSKEFEIGLAELLSNDYGIIRKAGVDLLIAKHIGTYAVNLMSLNEKRQLIVIDTLLEVPSQIKKTLPIVLQLKDSKFQEVRKFLLIKCIQLIFAYEKLIIEILTIHLKEESETDLIFLNKIKEVWEEHEKNLTKKRSLVELNPFINQRQLVNLYYRSEQEYQIEMKEEALKNSSIMKFGLGRNVPVIRGCAFKMEGNNDRINKMGKIENEVYIDKRYFINPAAYEFTYQNHILTKNYINEEE